MKKTYFAPELVKIELSSSPLMNLTSMTKNTNDTDAVGDGQQLSKGFGGGLWDEEVEE